MNLPISSGQGRSTVPIFARVFASFSSAWTPAAPGSSKIIRARCFGKHRRTDYSSATGTCRWRISCAPARRPRASLNRNSSRSRPGQPPGLFIDGGLTPHNNPALLMLMTALVPAYGLNWRIGPENLLIVSVGTGSFRPTLSPADAMRSSAIGLAIKSLAAMIAESQLLVLTLMTYLGQSPIAWPINSEIGDLGRVIAPTGDLFRFLRYDVRLEQSWLAENLGKHFSADFIAKLRPMDNPANMQALYELGQSAAADQVKRDDLMFAKV